MTNPFLFIARLCASSIMALLCAMLMPLAEITLAVILAVNAIVAAIGLSYLRLTRTMHGLLSWDGEHLVLSHRRGSLAAALAVQHVNALAEMQRELAQGMQRLFGALKRTNALCIVSLVINPGGMQFNRLDTIPNSLAGNGGRTDVNEKTSQGARPKKRKSVTFNENVQVHLIASSYLNAPTTHGYLASRYGFVNNFTLIPANTLVQQF